MKSLAENDSDVCEQTRQRGTSVVGEYMDFASPGKLMGVL
jgi:hypothetical protein